MTCYHTHTHNTAKHNFFYARNGFQSATIVNLREKVSKITVAMWSRAQFVSYWTTACNLCVIYSCIVYYRTFVMIVCVYECVWLEGLQEYLCTFGWTWCLYSVHTTQNQLVTYLCSLCWFTQIRNFSLTIFFDFSASPVTNKSV